MAYSPHVAVDLGIEMGEGEAEGRPEDQGLVPQLFGREYGERRQDLRYPAGTGGFQIRQPVINQPAVRPKRSVVDIKQFAGEDRDDIVEWLETWNRAAIANSWGPNEEKVMLPLYLKGRASQHYRHLQPEVRENVELLKRELEGHFNSPSQRLHAKNLLGERSQKPNETVADFYEDVCRLSHRGFSNRSLEFQQEKSLENFIKGLKPTIKKIFWGDEPESLDEAYQKARTRELYLTSKKSKFDVRAVEIEEEKRQNEAVNAIQGAADSQMQVLINSMKTIMENQNTLIALTRQNLQQSVFPPFENKGAGQKKPQTQKFRSDIECWNCRKMGHFRNKCEEPPKPRPGTNNA